MVFPLILAFLAASLYAAALSTPWGTRFSLQKPHVATTIGVLIALGSMALVDLEAARLALYFFVATGLPIIVRREWMDLSERARLTSRAQGDDK